MRNKTFWIVTGLFSLFMLYSGYSEIFDENAIKMLVQLGYPAYFSGMLGVAKILGAIALLKQEKFPTLAEWAYAGFTFDILAASYTLFQVGAGAMAIFPLVFLVPLAASYKLRPSCRCGRGSCACGARAA